MDNLGQDAWVSGEDLDHGHQDGRLHHDQVHGQHQVLLSGQVDGQDQGGGFREHEGGERGPRRRTAIGAKLTRRGSRTSTPWSSRWLVIDS